MLGLSKEVTKDDRGLFGFSELHTWAEIAREAARYRDIAAEQLQEPAQCRSMAFYIWYQVRAWLSLHLEHSNSILGTFTSATPTMDRKILVYRCGLMAGTCTSSRDFIRGSGARLTEPLGRSTRGW